MNKEKLQIVVDKMATQRKSDGTWELDDSYSTEFYSLVKKYAWTAAKKSDKRDPEDACSEVVMELWRALKKYGPRPQGIPFVDYTLKLKTRNTLTNRANRRFSAKCKLNFISKSLDQLESINIDAASRQECGLPSRIGRYLDCNEVSGEVKTYYDNFYKKPEKSLYNVYRKNETTEDQMDKVLQIGRGELGYKYITKMGKIIQLVGKAEDHADILVMATEKIIKVPASYEVLPYQDTKPGTAAVKKEQVFPTRVSQYSTKAVDPAEKTAENVVQAHGLKVLASDVLTESKPQESNKQPAIEKSVPKKERKMTKKMSEKKVQEPKEEAKEVDNTQKNGSKKALVLSMLKAGECSRDGLAEAVMKAFPDDKSATKVKNYISVIIALLKKVDKVNVVSCGRGSYKIE